MSKKYEYTLVLPPLEGQYKWWAKQVLGAVRQADRVVQLGNLINVQGTLKDSSSLGPNNALLKYVLYWRTTFDYWQQVVGMNEILALNFPDKWTNGESNRLLRRMWFDEDPTLKATVATVNKQRLVTHGGLSYGLWQNLGRPQTAEEAASLLNSVYKGRLYFGDSYRLTKRYNYAVDPVFGDAPREVYPSWLNAPEPMPFDQVHGSVGLNSPLGREVSGSPYSPYATAQKLRMTAYGSELVLPLGGTFLNVHPMIPLTTSISRMEKIWSFRMERSPASEEEEAQASGDEESDTMDAISQF